MSDKVEFFDPIDDDIYLDAYEPVVPCRRMSTRPCVELSLTDYNHYRKTECDPGDCLRHERKVDVNAEIERLTKEQNNG